MFVDRINVATQVTLKEGGILHHPGLTSSHGYLEVEGGVKRVGVGLLNLRTLR